MSENTAILNKVDEQTLTLIINGEVQEVKHQLEELKGLLLEKQIQNVQYADKIYNIEKIDTANFGIVTGKQAFNELLTKSIITSIQEKCSAASQFLNKASSYPNWESRTNISDKAKEIIAYSFVGVIGIQIRKLMAIGKETTSNIKERKYISKSIDVVNYSLNLVNFILLSDLWENQKKSSNQLAEEIYKVITNRFDTAFAFTILEQFHLLDNLLKIYSQYKLVLPITELSKLQENNGFHANITALQKLNDNLDKEQYNLLTCFEAEKGLANFFEYFSFLVKYNMASIKNIGYREVRNDKPIYLHRFTTLGIDNKAQIDEEKILGMIETVHTDAVLFYEGENYKKNINLYPFVIDYNTLTSEHGAKVCFFQNIKFEDDSLEYVFLEDNSKVNIEKKKNFQEGTSLGELMMDKGNRITFNLNCVVSGFEQAKKEILAELDLD